MSKHPAPATLTDELVPAMLDAITNLNDGLAQLSRGLVSRDAVLRRGANYTPVPAGGAGPISYSAGQLVGWSLTETAGVAATVALLDGHAGGELLAITPTLNASGHTIWLLPAGVGFTRGLWLAVTPTAGGNPVVTGTVYTTPIR